MRYLSEDNRNFFRYRFFLEWFVGGFDKTNQQSQVEDGFIEFTRKCDFSNWEKEDLEKLIDMAYKSVGKLKNYISYTNFKEFFGEPTEAHLGTLSNYLISSLNCSEEEGIKIICYVNILYYAILRCKDEYRSDLIEKLYNLTGNSDNNFNKFLFQMILSEIVKNDWEKLKEFFWKYNYFSKTKDEILWLLPYPYNIINFNSEFFTKSSKQNVSMLRECKKMLSELIKDICDSLDDSDIKEFHKIFHINDNKALDKILLDKLDKLKNDPNGIAEIKQHLKELKKICSKVFGIALALVGVETQKEEEKHFLEIFCKLMRDEYGLHIGKYEGGERPDFIVPIDGKRIGIELTTYNTEKERRNLQPETEVLVPIKELEALYAVECAIYKKIGKYVSFNRSSKKIDELWLVLYSPDFFHETTMSIVYFSASDNHNSRSNLDLLKDLLKDDTTFELIFIIPPKPANKELYDKFLIRNESALFKKR